MAAEGRFFDGLLKTSAEEEKTSGEIRERSVDRKAGAERTEEWKMGKAVELREVEIAALKPYERNAKQHGKEQVDRIARSIREMGFLSPCLIARQIRNSSQPGEKVLDLFGGSGTTLIACEQMDRRCFMMEFDPHYADVIVDRWEKMTGLKALKVNGYTTGGGGCLKTA